MEVVPDAGEQKEHPEKYFGDVGQNRAQENMKEKVIYIHFIEQRI
jgi:hypothetical protein